MSVAGWSSYTLRALAYAEAAAAGGPLPPPLSAVERPVGELERLAAQRFLDDLAAAAEPGARWWYSDEAAARAIRHMERLQHVKGEWRSQPIRFEPVQLFGLCQVFGWLEAGTNLRRFREVYEEEARKNAKSTKMMAVGHFMLSGDGEQGAEIYNGANSEKQAGMIWKPARESAANTPGYQSAERLQIGVRRIEHLASGSTWEPLVRNPGDGGNPHCAIVDEYHEHLTSAQYDSMQTGMGSRRQPLLWVITTAGDDTSSPCYELRDQRVEILQRGARDERDDRILVLIFAMDAGDDWREFGRWLKANPMVGVSCDLGYLRAQWATALKSAAARARLLSRHAGVWSNAAVPWINTVHLKAAMDRGRGRLDWSDLRAGNGREVSIGLDGSIRVDFTSVAATARTRLSGRAHYLVKARHYLPEARLEGDEGRTFRAWADAGWITVHDGEEIDLAAVQVDVCALVGELGARWMQYDDHYMQQLAQAVQTEHPRLERIELPLGGARGLSPIMREVEAALAAERVTYDGDPVLEWMLGNIEVREDERGNIYPRRPKTRAASRKKIDGGVAKLMSMAPFVRVPGERGLEWGEGQEIVAA